VSRGVAAGRSAEGDRRFSRDVRVWSLRVRESKKAKGYGVRWRVAREEQHRTFASRALAEGFRSELITHQQRGVLFDITTGLPEPLLRAQRARSWFEHACRFVDMKWDHIAPKSRTSIADALATVTPALLATDRGQPSVDEIRRALYGWAFVTPARRAGRPASELAATVRWLERNTVVVSDLDDPVRGPELVRAALDMLARQLDGKPASPNTVARKRAVFYSALSYAVEVGLLVANPIDRVAWRAPRAVETIDRRVVVNQRQARTLLTAVAVQPGVARRLVAFFACIYYAGLRPAEALDLREDNLIALPAEGWGEILLSNSSPRTGRAWTNTGRSRERRGLKHRAADDTRPVPAHPDLVAILRAHVDTFGIASDGRLFIGPRRGTIGDSTYTAIWQRARELVLTPAQVRSPLAARPYDLRHAALSTWLNAGVPPTQVAEWAGHSVQVLLRTYAKCIVGQDTIARRRIEEAFRDDENPTR
jgi:integrase